MFHTQRYRGAARFGSVSPKSCRIGTDNRRELNLVSNRSEMNELQNEFRLSSLAYRAKSRAVERSFSCGTSDPAHTKNRKGVEHPTDSDETRRVVSAQDGLLLKKIEVTKHSWVHGRND